MSKETEKDIVNAIMEELDEQELDSLILDGQTEETEPLKADGDTQTDKLINLISEMNIQPFRNTQNQTFLRYDTEVFPIDSKVTKGLLAGEYIERYGQAAGAAAFGQAIAILTAQAYKTEAVEYTPAPADGEDEDSKSQADMLLELCGSKGIYLFHNEHREAFARIMLDGHKEIWGLNDENFRLYLAKLFYDEYGRTAKNDAIAQATAAMKSKAVFQGEEIPLSVRCAWSGGNIFYDLSNQTRQSVIITNCGWNVTNDTPILFQQYNHQRAQATPIPGGDILQVLDFITIKPEYQFLFLVYLAACFVPDIPHPCLIIYGEKGAAKSTTSQMLKRLIDPSGLELLTLPKDVRELTRMLSKHAFVPFDNISSLSAEISDELCKAVTGAGNAWRSLYTNNDDVVFNYKRCILLNGINNVASRADLLDRSIMIELQRISETDRRPLNKLLKEFDEQRGAMLGGIFDVVSKALSIYPTIRLDRYVRMADFDEWGAAIAQAIDPVNGQTLFMDEYRANRKIQTQMALDGDPVATCIIELMRGRTYWQGRASDLLREIEEVAYKIRVDTHSKYFPKAANALTRKLNLTRSNLADVGIHVDTSQRDRNYNYITITADERKTDTQAET